ncbi:MAG: hypothetical protein A2087_05290 [Spirochaetes bacterium GWD1_61_31]|nr:MAG: hypothetical protein A2Y37_10645 [Spirochaetes bacterium GWB1_60_80]OHD29779.1 MAG: hypothetical protein A2004_04920 [Spirochaetes bacterium GWC1_61_12]OHD42879.1 MAG: hypothetical protein A2Y35_13870 [Spirochaetes bacterium GWE1_60_18]OHD43456.1 MAG: hypothetical protein A2087_05290 [Spirochaetes bacterium GWD1_61_31]OHD59583.1 MAG: hypothetical protein A2Y32_12685 [Spirochaetes bacterium GWF1_60_12]HAP43742.1 hypothetical protein [Spirochaetaceae bacterium]
MISLQEALDAIAARPICLPAEAVPLSAACGRLLVQPLYASLDQPPFDKAAMDGWLWLADASGHIPAAGLEPFGTIAAGGTPATALEPGQALRIMTGAALPQLPLVVGHSACIQRFEWAVERDGRVHFTQLEKFDNIIRRGENAKQGDCLLSPRLLRAQDIAILAADGRATAQVATRPRVAVLSTGTELVEAGQPLHGSSIYDSNRPQLLAHLAGYACQPEDCGTVPDDYQATLDALAAALEGRQLLVLSGGVSMGDFDYVPRALVQLGVKEIFHGVAMRPGKPTFFGFHEASGCHVIGLPGNPVSVFVNTEVLVKPLLARLAGLDYRPLTVRLPLVSTIRRKQLDRAEFLPVCLGEHGVEIVPYGGSSAIQALAAVDGFICLAVGVAELSAGELVDVRLIR